MARVRCIMMQKNETRMLEAWIKYYGYMFSYENLYILDNGSTKKEVFDILKKYHDAGVNVFYEYDKKDDFENKGEIIKGIVDSWDEKNEEYDYVIPIDCDEFVVFSSGEKISPRRKDIHDYLDSLDVRDDVFLMVRDYINDPSVGGIFFPSVVPKSFFPKGNVGEIDHGFHHPKPASENGEVRKSNLGYIHFHNKPFKEVLYHAKEKLEKFVDVNNLEELKDYEGNGVHLKEYFFMSPDDYNKRFHGRARIFINGFLPLLRAISVDVETLFGVSAINSDIETGKNGYLVLWPDETSDSNIIFSEFDHDLYAAVHEDIAKSGVDPLSHFCEYGFKEGRVFNAGNKVFKYDKFFLFNPFSGKGVNSMTNNEVVKYAIDFSNKTSL